MIHIEHTCTPAIAALRTYAHHAGAEAADLTAQAAAAHQHAQHLDNLAAAAKRRYFSHLVAIHAHLNLSSPFQPLANP